MFVHAVRQVHCDGAQEAAEGDEQQQRCVQTEHPLPPHPRYSPPPLMTASLLPRQFPQLRRHPHQDLQALFYRQ